MASRFTSQLYRICFSPSIKSRLPTGKSPFQKPFAIAKFFGPEMDLVFIIPMELCIIEKYGAKPI